MGIVDYVLIGWIVGGAFYLLYRSLWKKRGYCSGCNHSEPAGDVKDRRSLPDCKEER